MGRRAKNKQGDPESLQELSEHVSPKKLGKRKAGMGKGMGINSPQPAKKSKHKDSLQDDDSLNGVENDESSEGWEGLQDEDTLPGHTRYVASCTSRQCSLLQTQTP